VIIYPQGILGGERLASCSDDAQLHFPRLVALGNGFGRMELNARAIIEAAYANFEHKPSREQLTRWLQEYAREHLLFIYTDFQGHPWCQWCGVPERMLPRFKTAADKRSPAPPAKALADYEEEYARAKKSSADFIDISEDFGNVPKASEELETFPLGIGIGIGVGKGIGKGEKLSAPSAQSLPASPAEDTSEHFHESPATNVKKTRSKSKVDGTAVILPAFLPETEWREWLLVKKGAKTPYAQQLAIGKLAGFHANGYDVKAILNSAIEGAWASVYANESTPKRKVVYEEVDPATFWAGTGIPTCQN
jgi:uncharacterized protein YqcC (DUF446 family)